MCKYRTINNLRFADDIGLLTQVLRHAQVLLDRVDKVSSKYGKEISDSNGVDVTKYKI